MTDESVYFCETGLTSTTVINHLRQTKGLPSDVTSGSQWYNDQINELLVVRLRKYPDDAQQHKEFFFEKCLQKLTSNVIFYFAKQDIKISSELGTGTKNRYTSLNLLNEKKHLTVTAKGRQTSSIFITSDAGITIISAINGPIKKNECFLCYATDYEYVFRLETYIKEYAKHAGQFLPQERLQIEDLKNRHEEEAAARKAVEEINDRQERKIAEENELRLFREQEKIKADIALKKQQRLHEMELQKEIKMNRVLAERHAIELAAAERYAALKNTSNEKTTGLIEALKTINGGNK